MLLGGLRQAHLPQKGVRSMISTLLFATLSLASAAAIAPSHDVLRVGARAQQPYIHVWLNSDGYYHRGERARVYFETELDAFVTVFRVDTDGRVRIVFPHEPWHDNYVYGGRQYEVVEPYASHGKYSFVIDEHPGQGYIFAVASYDPFDYSAFTGRDHWDYRAIGQHGRVTGDPYVAFDELVDHILPAGYDDYMYDVTPYFVERRYTYPRFLCYDCHTRVAFTYWNPYRHSCVRFRLVIYDDPYYYPARAYAGTRVVYKRPVRYTPRYVFKDHDAAKPFITRERQRPANAESGRRVVDRGATNRDVGGVGRVPAPITRRPDVPNVDDRQLDRRRIESGDRVEAPRRAEPEDARRSATSEPRGRESRRVGGGERGAEHRPAPSSRPQLERREPRRPTATPERVRGSRPSSQSAPSKTRPQPRRATPEKPQAQQAPNRRAPSGKLARPSRKADARPSPTRRPKRPDRKPKPPEKDPER